MAVNPYFYEKLVAERHAEIRREVQRSRLSAHSGRRHTFAQSVVSGFNSLLAKRDSHLSRPGQQSKAYFQEG